MRRFAATLVFAAVATVGLTAWARFLDARLVDDAYIFFRYAENIVRGSGPVYNAGERVEGFSSIAWTCVVAGVRLFTDRLEGATLLLGGGTAVAIAVLVYSASLADDRERSREWFAWILGLGTLVLPAVAYWALSGMEQLFFTLVVAATLLSALSDVDAGQVTGRTVALIAVTLLTRSEGLLLGAWVAICMMAAHGRFKRPWWRAVALPLALAAIPLLAVICARLLYFGSLVPNTYYSKVTPDHWDRVVRGALYVRRALIAHGAVIVVSGAFAWLGLRRGILPWFTAAFLLGWAAIWCAYVQFVGGDHFAMFRFFLPALLACLLLIGRAWPALRSRLRPRERLACGGALVVALGVSTALSLSMDGARARNEGYGPINWGKAGRWIAEHTPPDTVIATNVIGAIGYFSQRPLLDMIGLVDPVIARRGAIFPWAAPGHGRYFTDYVFDRAPDLVVYYTSGSPAVPPFSSISDLWERAAWHFALLDFVNDPRCAERYVHIAIPLPDGTWLEAQKKRAFTITGPYLQDPSGLIGESAHRGRRQS